MITPSGKARKMLSYCLSFTLSASCRKFSFCSAFSLEYSSSAELKMKMIIINDILKPKQSNRFNKKEVYIFPASVFTLPHSIILHGTIQTHQKIGPNSGIFNNSLYQCFSGGYFSKNNCIPKVAKNTGNNIAHASRATSAL